MANNINSTVNTVSESELYDMYVDCGFAYEIAMIDATEYKTLDVNEVINQNQSWLSHVKKWFKRN